eukprot:TRINITY_DN6617_c0_g1_i1.p1 TRINITY_DN6617_c0_g1~~TRINITY_DN6617_c0_g1_i1.p1  ORF type:complete len:564 (+),score=100.33 TRINITY_DN6617_c0_g1_i1:99-1694(+)
MDGAAWMDSTASLTASPDTLSNTMEWVTVSWQNVDDANDDDWIGAYSQTPFNLTSTPSKFRMCSEDPSFKTGSGSLRFRLVNMRSSYTFVLFRSGLKDPKAAATSNEVRFLNNNQPLQVHLALTSHENEMQVSWNSGAAKSPVVQYGRSSGALHDTAVANTSTYTAHELCGAPATTNGWMNPGLLHNAVLTGLAANTTYYYRVGEDVYGWSDEFSFVSAPAVTPSAAFKFIVYGDMGKGEVDGSNEHWPEPASLNTTSYVQKEIDQGNALVLHVGDISYAVGYSSQWDEFMAQIQPIAARVPYMTCIGNHERDFPLSGSYYEGTDSGGECGVPYERRFRMPRPSDDQPWYSFDFGSVHFILMSTEHNFEQGAQYDFIEQDLASVNRTRTPWVVFSGHRPMYISSTNYKPFGGDQTVALALRDHLEPLLFKYNVNLAFWAHHHSYQRTCPVYKLKCMPANADGSNSAPVHVVVGMAGKPLSTNIEPHRPAWFEYVDDKEWGYTRLSVTEHSLTMEFVSDRDGAVRDSYTMRR